MFGEKHAKATRSKRLGKNVRKLIIERNKLKLEKAMKAMMTNEVTINLNMLCLFIEDINIRNLNTIQVGDSAVGGMYCDSLTSYKAQVRIPNIPNTWMGQAILKAILRDSLPSRQTLYDSFPYR